MVEDVQLALEGGAKYPFTGDRRSDSYPKRGKPCYYSSLLPERLEVRDMKKVYTRPKSLRKIFFTIARDADTVSYTGLPAK